MGRGPFMQHAPGPATPGPAEPPPAGAYSVLSASIGSIPAARRAGT
jgi:hypothetical protein